MHNIYLTGRTVTFSDKIPDGAEGELWGIGPGEPVSLAKLSQKFQFTKHLYLISSDIGRVFSDFCRRSRVIDAGGGVARNERGEILMIFRRGLWDLPKGKSEAGEPIEECALREVEEECGLSGLVRENYLTTTYHAYQVDCEWVLKRTLWYWMRYGGNESPKPEVAEGISFAGWIPVGEVAGKMSNSYQNIADVLRAAGLLQGE